MTLRQLLTASLLASCALITPWGARAQQPVAALESPIVTWTNYYRQRQGLSTLEVNPQLTQMARMHAWHMALREEMAHELEGSTLVERARRAGYAYQAVGENVAYNEGYPNPAWKCFDGWMRSPSHWKNIIGPQYSEIGVGVYRSATGKYYACQVFGSPLGSGAPPMLAGMPAQGGEVAPGLAPGFGGVPVPGGPPVTALRPPGRYGMELPTAPATPERHLGFSPNYELADQEFYPYMEFGAPNWAQP